MRIGIIRDTLFTNEPRGFNIAKLLTKAGFEVYVLCYGEENGTEKIEGITLDRFDLNNAIKRKLHALVEVVPIYKYLWAKKIHLFVKKHQIDVLQVHDLYMIGSALKANKKLKLPIVANFHENFAVAVKTYNWTKSFAGRIITKLSHWDLREKKYLNKIDKLILLSESFKKMLLGKYSFLRADNIFVYPNVPDLDEFAWYKIQDSILKKDDAFIIFYFGVMAERRGIFLTFEVLKLLIKSINVKLLLIGPVDRADQQKFQQYIDDATIKDSIIYYPWKDIQFLPSYVKVSNVCISPIVKNPQHDSGVANKVFQYMLLEKPVVVSNSTEQERIVIECGCGLVFKSEDIDDFTQKILYLYEHPEECEKMGRNGKKAILEKYNTSTQSKQIIKLYDEIRNEINKQEIK